MLNKKTFTVGIGLIISLIGEKANHLKTGSAYDIMFNQLNDMNDNCFIEGISLMLKSEDIKFFPSVFVIRKYVDLVTNFGYSKEEILDMAEVRRITKQPYSNKYFDNYISFIDIEKSKNSNKLELKGTNLNAIEQK